MKLMTLLLILLAVALTSCATAPSHAPVDSVKHIRTVSIVSTIGDRFVRSYTGVTVFGNEYHVQDITRWGLDSTYEKQIADALHQVPGIDVVAGKVDRHSFPRHKELSGSPDWNEFAPALTQQCTSSGADGVLLLVKTGDAGVGVWVSRQYSVRELSISATLALFDCSTGRVVAADRLVTGPASTFGGLHVPTMPLPEQWPLYGDWQPGTYEDAHSHLVELPKKAWSYTVRQLFSSN